jgi:hypothetical protein
VLSSDCFSHRGSGRSVRWASRSGHDAGCPFSAALANKPAREMSVSRHPTAPHPQGRSFPGTATWPISPLKGTDAPNSLPPMTAAAPTPLPESTRRKSPDSGSAAR